MAKEKDNKLALNYAEIMAAHIREICHPLFSNLDFSAFAYIKIFPDNKMLHLTTDPQWSRSYFEQQFYNENNCFEVFRRSLLENEKKAFILTGDVRDKYTTWLYDYGIWHSCSLYTRHNGIIEGWAFGTCRENKKILDFYLNHIELLNHFINYFNEKIKEIIFIDDEKKLINLHKNNIILKNIQENEIEFKEFLEKTSVKSFIIEIMNKRVLLTKREVEYLNYFLKGYSAKKIAACMKISPRTAESYFNTIKNKLNLKKKEQIIGLFNLKTPFFY